MKTTIAWIVALAASATLANAKIVELRDVPGQVRAVIKAQVPDNKLQEITINLNTKADKYVVKLNLKGGNKLRVEVSTGGQLIKVIRDVNLDSLPNKVRKAIDRVLDEADEIVEVERVTRKGQVSYVIKVDTGDADDDHTKIVISRDGIIIDSQEDLDFNELSQKLRKAINKLLPDDFEIEEISRVVEDGEVTYHLEVRDGNTSLTAHIVLDSNGVLIDGDLDL